MSDHLDCAHGIPMNLRCGACEAEEPKMTDITETLAERGSRYGSFTEHARITQQIKRAMIGTPNWSALEDDQREALEMVAHKIGRILNGDPNYHDSWHDIIGYTKLVADRLQSSEMLAAISTGPARNPPRPQRDAA